MSYIKESSLSQPSKLAFSSQGINILESGLSDCKLKIEEGSLVGNAADSEMEAIWKWWPIFNNNSSSCSSRNRLSMETIMTIVVSNRNKG